MMKYLMLVCSGTDAPESAITARPAEGADGATLAIEDWVEQMDSRGARLDGDRLADTGSSTTVLRRDGKTLIVDGPFTETKEQILGFDILECADLDEAIEIAAKHPNSAGGAIELRPFWSLG